MKSFFSSYKRIILFFVIFILAILRICAFEYGLSSDAKKINEGQYKTVVCKVRTVPSSSNGSTTFIAQVKKGLPIKSAVFVKIKNLPANEVSLGDTVKLRAKVTLPKGPLNKGGYDFKGYLKSQRAVAVLTCNMIECSVIKKSALSSIYAMRTRITEDIFLNFAEPEAALINALVTGSKDKMPPLQKENFRRAGVYHIIAVSGLHLGLLLMFLLASVGSIKIKSPIRKLVTFVITFVAGMFLMVFTGFGISVQRAAFMALFLCCAGIVSRDYSPMTGLFCVLGIVIFTEPGAYCDPSCQLSFGATFGILLCAPLLKKIPFKNKLLRAVSESVIISVGSSVATLPFIIYHFGSVSLVAVVSNLIVIMIVPLLLLLCYVFSIVTLVSPTIATFVVANVLAPIARAVNIITEIMASPKFSYVPLSLTTFAIILAECIGIIAVCKLKKKLFVYILAGVFLVANAGFISYNIFNDEVTVSFLRVGQGDCTIIHSGDGSTFMIDCGSETDFSIGSSEIKPYLEGMGVNTVDAVFLTHYHTDHISGLGYLIESGVVESIVLPKREPDKKELKNAEDILRKALSANIPVYYAASGDYITFKDKHKFEIIHPEANLSCDGNNSSMAICYSYDGSKVLFMGDNESKGQLLFAKNLMNCDIIKLAHHGGKSITSDNVYKHTKPMYSIVSCGVDNKYGHPHEDTLKAFEKTKILRTDTADDAIVFTLKGGKVKER